MSNKFPHRTVDPRRFMRIKNLHNKQLVQEQLVLYSDVAESEYTEIKHTDGKIQLLDSHVTKVSGKTTKIDATLLKYFPGAMKDLLSTIKPAVEKFLEAARNLPEKETSRGEVTPITYHFGCWEVRGNLDGKSSLMKHQFACDLVKALEEVSAQVDSFFERNFPEHGKFMCKVIENDLPGNVSKFYRMFALNDSISDWHVDYGDFIDGFCAVIPFGDSDGDFEGGELLLPDISTKVAAKEGDLLFFRSQFMIHKNAPVTRGHRRSLVFYTHQLPVSRFLMLKKPELISVKMARQYCREYWCYKYIFHADYSAEVPQKVSFAEKKKMEKEVIENDDHDE